MHIRVQAWESGFDKMADHLRSFMDELHSKSFFRTRGAHTWRPPLNLYETREAFVVCVDLAGMARERIDVTVDQDRLLIRGERDQPQPMKPAGEVCVHLMEIDCGPFQREVQLPANVDQQRITAAYRHGYLWITVPRAGGTPPPAAAP